MSKYMSNLYKRRSRMRAKERAAALGLVKVKRPPLTTAERARSYRQRLKQRMAEAKLFAGVEPSPGTTAPTECDLVARRNACDAYFNKTFTENDFGHSCAVCDRLWFYKELKPVKPRHYHLLRKEFPGCEVERFSVCRICLRSLNGNIIPTLSKSNGFSYPPKPVGLPPLDPLTDRLISPRLPFSQIRRLQREGGYGIVAQVINLPVDFDNMVQKLPRRLDDDHAININIGQNLIHESSCLGGFVKKPVVEAWLEYLITTPLYKQYNVTVDEDTLKIIDEKPGGDDDFIEPMSIDRVPESQVLLARQQTLHWNQEDQCLDTLPDKSDFPIDLIYDNNAEELSFPAIYYGVPRNLRVPVTPYMMVMSEIRRTDRRGVTPSHVLYATMKILRSRLEEGLRSTLPGSKVLEDRRHYLEECFEKNVSFLKSIPNSLPYWVDRKKDLLAMMRQLGRPTMFLTMSANEMRWPKLLAVLHRLNDNFKDVKVKDPIRELNRTIRSTLVNEDPVTCCIYFNKLVDVILGMLQTKQKHNPFGRYRVADYFLRIDFQRHGSPQVHILLWLENDPREPVSEDMPLTVLMVNELCSLSDADLPRKIPRSQIRIPPNRDKSTSRFKVPYWPMSETKVLVPMSEEDNRKYVLKSEAEKLHKQLDKKYYDTVAEFLSDNKMTMDLYLDTIRSTLRHPTVMLKRNFHQIYTNTFHPWIAGVLNSDMNLGFILDERSCVDYIAEYVAKPNRCVSHLRTELMKLHDQHPEENYAGLLQEVVIKLLKSVEMSPQECAWFLLRQPMSQSSRKVVFVPTMLPHERQKARKRRGTVDRDNLTGDNPDLDTWAKSIVQRYEERPGDMEVVYLAQFAAWYAGTRSVRKRKGDKDSVSSDEDFEDNGRTTRYHKRQVPHVIRHRNYGQDDIVNYKREMVTLYLPFRNEMAEVVAGNKFEGMYDDNETVIMERRKLYESNVDIEKVMAEMETSCEEPDDFSSPSLRMLWK